MINEVGEVFIIDFDNGEYHLDHEPSEYIDDITDLMAAIGWSTGDSDDEDDEDEDENENEDEDVAWFLTTLERSEWHTTSYASRTLTLNYRVFYFIFDRAQIPC